MPVEIKELVIRTVVGTGTADPTDDAATSPTPATASPDTAASEALVQECVRQVLRILAENRER